MTVFAADSLGPGPAQIGDFEKIFTKYLQMATTWALIAAFIMLLYGGFKYLTAGGDPKTNESARNTITYAILGLVLTIGAWFILRFVGFFTGVNVTNFSINFPGS